MNPTRYLRPAMIRQRQRCLQWIMAHRNKPTLWLAKLEDTPPAVERKLRSIASQWIKPALEIAACCAIGAAYGITFGLFA